MIAVAIPVAVVSDNLPAAVTGHRAEWIVLLVGAALVIAALTWLSGRSARQASDGRLFLLPPVPGWIDRAELAEVETALTSRGSRTVALTTGLVGAGGFGKPMLAARACQTPSVQRRFRGGIVWVTLGRDVDAPGLAARISELIANVGGQASAFTSPEQAGHALALGMARRGPVLLVVDDVWTAGQLEPFLMTEQSCRLLVTSRRPVALADAGAQQITVDAMPDAVGRRLLTRNLPVMSAERERELLELTGRWALLLSLVNYRLADEIRRGGGIDTAAAAAAARLHEGGPAALDITDSGKRQTAVAATIDYSLEVIEEASRNRFYELGIFAEDAEIPLATVALPWQGTAGLDTTASELLCERLDGLSLVTLTWADDVRVMVMHDVIRDFALSRLSRRRTVAAHAALIDTARPGEGEGITDHHDWPGTPWWRLPQTPGAGYLWQNLTYHLQAADMAAALDQVCGDLRFLAIRLRRSGPGAVETDLARSSAHVAGQLRHVIAHNSRLLRPTSPEAALITTLTSLLGGIPELADQLRALRGDLDTWTAWPVWPLPDQRSDVPVCLLIGHRGGVSAVAISPDGTWLVT